MAKLLTKKDVLADKVSLPQGIMNGEIFIYPTDTLHGLGTNAQNKESVEKIISLKKSPEKAFLVIAPSLEWIFENCIISNDAIKSLIIDKLPGPYSFVLKLKNTKTISPLAINFGETIGVRLPDNWFTKIIAESGIPFISTSINRSGEPSAKSLEDIPREIFDAVNHIIWDDTSSSGKASTIIDVTSGIPKILRP